MEDSLRAFGIGAVTSFWVELPRQCRKGAANAWVKQKTALIWDHITSDD